jgi:hypothetical protein
MHKTLSSASFNGAANVFSSHLRRMLPPFNLVRGGDIPNARLHSVT